MYSVWQLKNDSTAELKQFIDVETNLYQADENYIPPLYGDMKKMLQGKRYPLIKNGEHALFLVLDEDGTTAGRVLCGLNTALSAAGEYWGGYFSLFECVKDYKAAKALLDAVVNWMKDKQVHTVAGPVSPAMGFERLGFLINGEGPPVLWNAYTRDYYADFMERYGFVKDTDYFAYTFDPKDFNLLRYEKIGHLAQKQGLFAVHRLDTSNIEKEAADIFKIISYADREWKNTVKPGEKDIAESLRMLRKYYNRTLCFIARSGDRPVGFLMALRDYSPILKKMNGRVLPFGWYYYLSDPFRLDTVRVFAQMAVKDLDGIGVHHAMHLALYRDLNKLGIRTVEASCVNESDLELRMDIEKSGGKHYRTYRVYRYHI